MLLENLKNQAGSICNEPNHTNNALDKHDHTAPGRCYTIRIQKKGWRVNKMPFFAIIHI